MREKEYLHYNFDKVAIIPKDLYDKIWECENLFDNDNLIEELSDIVGEDVYEINCTLD